MKPIAGLGLYAVILAAVFGVGTAAGALVGPLDTEQVEHGASHSGGAAAGGEHDADPHSGDAAGSSGTAADGLAASRDGYALRLDASALTAGTPGILAFTIFEGDRALTSYDATHTKELHLVVVRRDLTGFQHLHPERDETGRWSTLLTVPEAGQYKVFADFTPRGRSPIVLAGELAVAGSFVPRPLPPPSGAARVDGYDVAVTVVAGATTELRFTVTRGGQPVTDLEPYLGARGHLVALRADDLAYLHVHPVDADAGGDVSAGPALTFAADVPSSGIYRLYLGFRHAGAVHTAAMTATIEDTR